MKFTKVDAVGCSISQCAAIYTHPTKSGTELVADAVRSGWYAMTITDPKFGGELLGIIICPTCLNRVHSVVTSEVKR